MEDNFDAHKQYYGLASSSVELAKIRKLLLAIDEGYGSHMMGKAFDEIDVDNK